jgi:hypothetical protein
MRITLVAEGTSDQALLPIIRWVLRDAGVASDLETIWADLKSFPRRPLDLAEKIRVANELFPCDLLIVHRDADGAGRDLRLEEITQAVGPLLLTVRYVCLVPITMSEAWLLFNEGAIRSASGNPYSRCQLRLPNPSETERIADPKHLLFEQLRTASELTGRRLRKFDRNRARSQVAEYIDDFSPLRGLTAFCAFEEDIRNTLTLMVPEN